MKKKTAEIRRKSDTQGFNFKTQVGAATIYRLDCPQLAEPAKTFARWPLLNWGSTQLKRLGRYYATKFTIDNCVVYVISLEGCLPETIIGQYKRNLLNGLYRNVFSIVCNGRVHEWASHTGGVILHAIAANKNPNLEILLAER